MRKVANYRATIKANRLALLWTTAGLAAFLGLAWFGNYDRAGALTNRNRLAAEAMIDTQIDTMVGAGRLETDGNLPLIVEAEAPRKPGHPYWQNRRLRHAAVEITRGNAQIAVAPNSGALIAEARRYLGGNPTGRSSLWCAAFLDMVLKRTGHRGGGNLASAYARYGQRVGGPEVGAIAVFSRKGGGHVGIVTGVDANGNPIVISGNHNHRVAESAYPRSRVVAYVLPRG